MNKRVENGFEEWQGARSHKFQGGLHIVQAEYKKGNIAFHSTEHREESKKLSNVKSKRHFAERESDYMPDWKPCLQMVKSASQTVKEGKITEIPCTKQIRALRHVEKFAMTKTEINRKPHSLWSKTLKQFKFQEEEGNVRALENWEKEILNKKKDSRDNALRNWRARLESLRLA
jgi:hypothetical protein